MKKKVKFLYIDSHSITRDFFEYCLKKTQISLVTLEDLSTFAHNLAEFGPELVLADAESLLKSLNTNDHSVFLEAYKKQPEKFVLCGKIEEIQQLDMNKAKNFLKPYSPHDLDLQLMTFMSSESSKKDQAH